LLPPSHDPSFPSDHATFAFGIATGLLLVSKGVGVPALILAALIGLSRVYTGEHYLSDVIGGALIGSGAALAAARARGLLEPLLARALRLARWLHLA
jgi:undecaprenyl-diphosphatase